jgi:hypothetical protein
VALDGPVFPLPVAQALLSADPARRREALAYHRQAEQRVADAVGRYNSVWARARTLRPRDGSLRAELDEAQAEYLRAQRQALVPCVARWRPSEQPETAALLPYVFVFLEWEARFPQDWPAHWGTKNHVLTEMSRQQLPPAERARLVDLVDAAVRRPHRCEDQQYALAARAADGPELRARLDAAAREPDPVVRLRAQFTRYLLDNPPAAGQLRRRHWVRWLRDEPPPE